jgi:hypothetical protein
VGGSFLAGLAVSLLIPERRSPSSKWPAQNGTAATLPLQSLPPSESSVFEPFHEEIAKVKGMAIGFVIGLVRDSIKDSVPQMASNIDELMDGITTKLGGEPVRPQSPYSRNQK